MHKVTKQDGQPIDFDKGPFHGSNTPTTSPNRNQLAGRLTRHGFIPPMPPRQSVSTLMVGHEAWRALQFCTPAPQKVVNPPGRSQASSVSPLLGGYRRKNRPRYPEPNHRKIRIIGGPNFQEIDTPRSRGRRNQLVEESGTV